MIALDARMAGHSGIGTYIRGLLSGFTPEQKKELTLLGDPRQLEPHGCRVLEAREPIYGLAEQWNMPGRLRKLGPGLLHTPHYNIPLFYGGAAVATVHDAIHILFPQFSRSPLARIYARAFLAAAGRRCRRILTDAQSTRRDLAALGVPEDKIRVVPLAVDASYRPIPPEEAAPRLAALSLSPGYILYVGNLRMIKNIPRLLKAYALMRRKMPDAPPLVLVGRDQLPRETAPYRNDPAVRFIGETPRESLPALYSGAAFFAFPSIYEGFGLPVLEAMACGCPVLASTAGSLPEVAGGAALMVPPENTELLAEAMAKLLSDNDLRRALREKGLAWARAFTWEKTARATFDVYREALA